MSFLLRRSLQAALTMLAAFFAVFVAIRTLPNNPVLARFGQHASPERVAREMADQGWDRPIGEQIVAFVRDAVTQGDLGESFAVTAFRRAAEHVHRLVMQRAVQPIEHAHGLPFEPRPDVEAPAHTTRQAVVL